MSEKMLEIIEYKGREYYKLNTQLKNFLPTLPDDILMQVSMSIMANPLQWFVPNGKQEELINTVADMMSKSRTPTVLYSAANGVGKCIPLSSPILMADGSWKELRSIKAGDIVLGHDYDGTKTAIPAKVLQVSRAGMKEVFKITFKDGGHIVASKEHSFPIKWRSGRGSKVVKRKLSEIITHKVNYVGGAIKFQQPEAIEFEHRENNLPIDPYLLGVLIGDGGLSREGVKFTSISESIISRVREICASCGHEVVHYSNSDYGIRRSKGKKEKHISSIIRELGLNVASGNKFVPDIYKTASIEDRKQLLAGLIDTDGSYKEYTTKSKTLADDFAFILRSIGGRAIIHSRKVNNLFTKWEDKEYVRIYWKLPYRLPLSLDYKQRIGKRPIEYANRVVKSIVSIGMEECGDMYIDHPKHCYVSHDFISTGNTEGAINILGNIIYGAQNGWFLKKPFLSWQNPKVVWYVTTKTCLTDTLIPEIKRCFPAGTYHFDKMGGQIERGIHFDNGWEMRMFTMDVSEDQMESASVGLVIIDEPAPESIWRAAQSRARMGMLTIMPMTPLNVEPYILDEIDRNKDSDLYSRITASVYDACEERGIRGHLEAKIIDEMVKKYPPDEVVARVYGDFMYFKERIWVNYDERIHFVAPEDYPVDVESDYIVQVVDPHDSRPTACIYGAIKPIEHSEEYKQKIREGKAAQQFRRIIFAETPLEQDRPYWEMLRTADTKLEDEPLMWAEYEDRLGIKTVAQRIIDKRFGFQTRLSGTIAMTYYNAGKMLDSRFHSNKRFVYTPSYDLRSTDEKRLGEIAYGHNVVMSMFDLLEDGKPGLVIWNTCYHTGNGAKKYIRQRTNNRNSNLIAAGETKIVEKYKDFADLKRYFCCMPLSTSYANSLKTAKEQKSINNAAHNRVTGKSRNSIIGTLSTHMRKAR